MATLLIKEDGTKVAGANTYVDTDDFEAYMDERGIESDERFLGPELTASALVRAADYLTNYYRGSWKGVKTYSDQTMPWPRTGATDEDGVAIGTGVIPVELQRAQIEVARILLKNVSSTTPVYEVKEAQTADAMIKSKKEKIDVIQTEVEYFAPVYDYSVPEADRLVGGLLSGSSYNMTIVRS